MMMRTLRLAFLASHGGSNMQAIIDSIRSGLLDAVPVAVISNNSGSGAAERAARESIPFHHLSSATHPDPKALARAILDVLTETRADLVILAGYMKKLDPLVINSFRNRVLNIHPALLPKFGGEGMYGINVHKAVLAAGEQESGPTVHLVDEHFDRGRILAQRRVPVLPGDTPELLAARVLAEEHIIYADTIRRIGTGEIDLGFHFAD